MRRKEKLFYNHMPARLVRERIGARAVGLAVPLLLRPQLVGQVDLALLLAHAPPRGAPAVRRLGARARATCRPRSGCTRSTASSRSTSSVATRQLAEDLAKAMRDARASPSPVDLPRAKASVRPEGRADLRRRGGRRGDPQGLRVGDRLLRLRAARRDPVGAVAGRGRGGVSDAAANKARHRAVLGGHRPARLRRRARVLHRRRALHRRARARGRRAAVPTRSRPGCGSGSSRSSGTSRAPGTMVAEGDMVILEHSEEWHWHTGEYGRAAVRLGVRAARRPDRPLVGLLGPRHADERGAASGGSTTSCRATSSVASGSGLGVAGDAGVDAASSRAASAPTAPTR